MNITRRIGMLAAALAVCFGAQATEVVYRIVDFNKSTGDFTLAPSGSVPKGSYAYFVNDYGATTGNRYNQIPRGKEASLMLEGWQGCAIRSITLSMCSNNKSGQVGLSIDCGKENLFTQKPTEFASEAWFGQWVSKDLNVYVDITRLLNLPAFSADEASITLKGGTQEGSVYINAITIDYEEAPGTELESPMGWAYEKLTKKSTLQQGDELIIFRNGCAATDVDGISTGHYLDVTSLASTSDVSNPDVLRFTLGKTEGEDAWTLTDQYNRQLGASGKQALAWDEGMLQWQISLGYDGATLTPANTGYGTLRFNAPAESYARFALYTSKTLPLPYLYRKAHQLEPVAARSLAFAEDEITASLSDEHLALHPTLMPTSTTDQRLHWNSTNEAVASVNGGYVSLLSAGETIITAQTIDGSCQASVKLIVTPTTSIMLPHALAPSSASRKIIADKQVLILSPCGKYTVNGVKVMGE